MIFLDLFLTFFKIGAVSFGGGYGMISLIKDDCLANGWLTELEILNFLAVAESTPGPIAINMATFVGSSQAGFLGSLCATLGVVLPSFIIILLISSVLSKLLRYAGVKALIGGIRPAVIALILGTALTMFLSVVIGITSVSEPVNFDVRALIIFAVIYVGAFAYSKLLKKAPSPILLILLSGAMGLLMYGL